MTVKWRISLGRWILVPTYFRRNVGTDGAKGVQVVYRFKEESKFLQNCWISHIMSLNRSVCVRVCNFCVANFFKEFSKISDWELNEDAMKACSGTGGIVPLINSESRWTQGVSLKPLPLYTRRKSPPGRFGGPQDRLGCFGEEINLTPLPGFQPWIVQSAA